MFMQHFSVCTLIIGNRYSVVSYFLRCKNVHGPFCTVLDDKISKSKGPYIMTGPGTEFKT